MVMPSRRKTIHIAPSSPAAKRDFRLITCTPRSNARQPAIPDSTINKPKGAEQLPDGRAATGGKPSTAAATVGEKTSSTWSSAQNRSVSHAPSPQPAVGAAVRRHRNGPPPPQPEAPRSRPQHAGRRAPATEGRTKPHGAGRRATVRRTRRCEPRRTRATGCRAFPMGGLARPTPATGGRAARRQPPATCRRCG